jgi:hypothetical protein
MRLSLLSAAAVLASALICPPASAGEDGDPAREARQLADQLANQGQRALEQRHYQDAADHFKRAEVLAHSPAHLLGLARGLAGLNHVVAAHEMYAQILGESPAKDAPASERKAFDDARKEDDDIATRLAHATITVTGPDAPYVVLDDVPLAPGSLGAQRPIDPGTHVVRATARGYEAAMTRFAVAEGGDVAAVLAMSPSERREVDEAAVATPAAATHEADPATTPAPSSGPPGGIAGPAAAVSDAGSSPFLIGAYASFGVGGLGLIVGVTEGLLGSSKRAQLAATCAPNCAQSEVDKAQTAFTLSTVGYVTAAVGLTTGITLLLLQPKAQPHSGPSIAPVVGPGSVGAVGQF